MHFKACLLIVEDLHVSGVTAGPQGVGMSQYHSLPNPQAIWRMHAQGILNATIALHATVLLVPWSQPINAIGVCVLDCFVMDG